MRARAASFSSSSTRSERQKSNEWPRFLCSAMRTFSSTVRCGNTAEIWNERTRPMRAMRAGGEPVISRPLKKIWPRVGERKCVSRLKQVVLPAPLGPIRAWMLPRRTFRDTSLTATKPLNSFVSARVSKMISSATLPRSVLGRLALFEEGVDTLPALLVREAGGDYARGKRVGLRRAEIHLLVEGALAGGELHRRLLGQCARQLLRLSWQSLGCHDAVDETPLERLMRADLLAGQEHLHRPLARDV